MPAVDAYTPRKFQQVMEETWSHLRAKRGTRHPVSFVFGRDCEGYDNLILFDSHDELQNSPWLHEDTWDRIAHESDRLGKLARSRGDRIEGKLWQFDGEYVVYKNGSRRFVGRVRRVRLLRPKPQPGSRSW